MPLKNRAAPCWFVVAFVLAASSAEAQNLSAAGILTCTTSETPPQSLVDATLSCGFQGHSGAGTSMSGTISRIGDADLPPGKRVLIWSVLAENPDIAPSDLEGRYSGVTGAEPAGRLVGGKANGIILDPVDRTVEAGDGPVPTVLDLELKATRA